MWMYEKKLQYPVKVNSTNPGLAQLLLTQYGGPDGELGAALRYLNQRFTMPTNNTKGLLTDIGTSLAEMFHYEKTLDKLRGKKVLLHTISTAAQGKQRRLRVLERITI